MNMVEQVGSGIGRILKDMENIGLPPPVYKTVGLFTVVFMRTSSEIEKLAIEANAETRVKTRVKILAAISKNNKITRDELATQLGITIKGIDWQIKKMKEEGLLNRIGSDKGGYWELIDGNK